MKLLVFDVETTGLITKKYIPSIKKCKTVYPHVVQLGWILYEVETQSFINYGNDIVLLPDGMSIPYNACKCHGITTEIMREEGKPIKEVLTNFISALKSTDYIIAHNIKFDKSILVEEMSRNGFINCFNVLDAKVAYYCTMMESIELCKLEYVCPYTGTIKPKKFPKLEELHKFLFSDDISNLHNAFIDVVVCLRCFYKLIYDEDILTKNKNIKDIFDKNIKTAPTIKSSE